MQSGKANGALRAEEILKKMISLHEEGIDDIEPTIVSFTTCINGWAKSGQDRAAAATRARRRGPQQSAAATAAIAWD